jgi:hypothetical protein
MGFYRLILFKLIICLFIETVGLLRDCRVVRIGGKCTCSLCIDEYNSSILVLNADDFQTYVCKISR